MLITIQIIPTLPRPQVLRILNISKYRKSKYKKKNDYKYLHSIISPKKRINSDCILGDYNYDLEGGYYYFIDSPLNGKYYIFISPILEQVTKFYNEDELYESFANYRKNIKTKLNYFKKKRGIIK